MNVRVDFTGTAFEDTAISLETLTGALDRVDLLEHLLDRLDYWSLRLDSEALYEGWRSRLGDVGRRVSISRIDGQVEGVAEAVDRNGALLIRERQRDAAPDDRRGHRAGIALIEFISVTCSFRVLPSITYFCAALSTRYSVLEELMGIRLDWEIEAEQEHRQQSAGEDPEARRKRRRARLRFLLVLFVLLALIGGAVGAVALRLHQVEWETEQLLRDSVTAEVAAAARRRPECVPQYAAQRDRRLAAAAAGDLRPLSGAQTGGTDQLDRANPRRDRRWDARAGSGRGDRRRHPLRARLVLLALRRRLASRPAGLHLLGRGTDAHGGQRDRALSRSRRAIRRTPSR